MRLGLAVQASDVPALNRRISECADHRGRVSEDPRPQDCRIPHTNRRLTRTSEGTRRYRRGNQIRHRVIIAEIKHRSWTPG